MKTTLTANSLYTAFLQLAEAEQTLFFNRIKAEFEPVGNTVVAYSAKGEPLTREQYIETINRGIAQCESGECTTHA